jgi:hypothetical protein
MRINEFTNAEEQMGLWKLISDNVWCAIRTQAEQQARAEAERAQQAKAKRRTKKRGGTSTPPRIPKPPPPKKLATQNQPPQKTNGAIPNLQVPTTNPLPNTATPNTIKAVRSTHKPQPPLATSAELQHKQVANTQPTITQAPQKTRIPIQNPTLLPKLH